MKLKLTISLILLTGLFPVGCKLRSTIDETSENHLRSGDSTLVCSIEALNLSEDMSVTSSKNDEVYFFIYDDVSKSKLSTYRFNGVFDKDQTMHSFNIAAQALESVTLIVIEEDSDRPIRILDSLVGSNLDSLEVYFKTENYTDIRHILGDDDVLSIVRKKRIETGVGYSIIGIHKMDKYAYNVTFE